MKLAWFSKERNRLQKSERIDQLLEKAIDGDNADIQGSYTDHTPKSPYLQRMTYEPFYGDELEAFEMIVDKYQKKNMKMSEAIEEAIEDGWLFVDQQGMLRVSEEEPA